MKIALSFTAVAAGLLAASAAYANSFTNGSFEQNGGAGQINYNTFATGWTVPDEGQGTYTFLYAPGTADTNNAPIGEYGMNALWGPNNGSANGLPATSPDGGYFIAQDGDFQNSPIQQVITGLTVGKVYQVGFDYAFTQQYGFDGATRQYWSVSLGGSAPQFTPDETVSSHGFTGWQYIAKNFTATATTETLSFMANGNLPVPPFALLDGVTFTQESGVPEPATWGLMIVGVGGIGVMARRRRAAAAVA